VGDAGNSKAIVLAGGDCTESYVEFTANIPRDSFHAR
jgi:3-deoxy-D-arabino-heptulosonate 7-phosphate (DAHP) synthase class II